MLQASASKSSQIHGYSEAPFTVTIDKIKYDESKRDAYRENLLTLLDSLFIDPDPQCCLASALQSCIAQAALTSFGRLRKHAVQKVNRKWYDAECKSAQAALGQLSEDQHEHAAKWKSYKQLLGRKRRAREREIQQNLCEMASRNLQSCWRQYKERQSSKCNEEQWKASFEALYNAPKVPTAASRDNISATCPGGPTPICTPDLKAKSRPDVPEPAVNFLNAVITHQDVTTALKRLRRRKAAGADGIEADFILDASEILLNLLVQTFNWMLDKGVPTAWCTSLIHPILQAGDPDNPSN